MRRRFSHVPSAGNQMSSLLRPSIISNRRPNAMMSVSQHSISSPRNSHGNRIAGVKGGGQSSNSSMRKKDAERLAEQRQQLARRLSGVSMNSSLHSSSVHRDDTSPHHSQHSLRKQRSAINLAHVNSAYRSNKSSFRDANVEVRSFSSGDHNILNDLHGIVPSPVVTNHAPIPHNPLIVHHHTVSESNDAEAGGGPRLGPAVVVNDMNRSGDVDGKHDATLEEANNKKVNDRLISLLRQSNKSPSNKLQSSNKMPSNRAIPIISDEGGETPRSPTSPSPRKASRPINVVYTGGASHT